GCGTDRLPGMRQEDAGRLRRAARSGCVRAARNPRSDLRCPQWRYPNVSHYFDRAGMNSAADVAHKLLHEAHVVVVPGEGFGTQDHVRISYATSPENLQRGLERMRDFF